MKKKHILFILIALMTIGFASVTTNLMVNGSITLGNDIKDYDIKFTKSILNNIEDNNLISEDGKKINYNINLTKTNKTSELVYEITNNSKQFNAKVNVTCKTNEDIVPETYTIDTTNKPEVVKSNGRARGSIIISLTGEEEINGNFECSLSLESLTTKKEYKDILLKGTDPIIKTELIPVTLDDKGKVTYADTEEEWYNYGNKKWANAVILSDTAGSYNVGDTIPESDIESYFVWIPKYKYKLWNVGTTDENIGKHSIDIVFGTEDTKDIEGESCVTPMISGETGSCNNGEYMTHPAFISFGVNGLWVGKYETGYKGANTTSEAEQNNANSSNIIIKPNVYSWRNSTVSNMFDSSYNYKREMDSHMMKNTEWGAVAYLSHSGYGINKEINVNNNSSHKTGYSATADQSKYPGVCGNGEDYNQLYNTEVGYLASTTGNITGIYDMSGGAWEYVSSYIDGNIGSSGFTDISIYNQKYFDIYNSSSTISSYQYRILGDATGEMGPFSSYKNNWYDDSANFVEWSPYFHRGGGCNDGILAGQFYFSYASGTFDGGLSFRLILAV